MKTWRRRWGVAVGWLGVLGGCGGATEGRDAEPAESETVAIGQNWGNDTTGMGLLPGHESILRNGVARSNGVFGTAFPTLSRWASCSSLGSRPNPLLAGNCATDAPEDRLARALGYAQVPDRSEWHHAPTLQSIHFLRNYVGSSGVVGGWRSCLDGRDRIVSATKLALYAKHRLRDNDGADYFAGHGTHVIADSFAPPHVERSDDMTQMLQICTYGRSADGVCNHGTFPDGATEFPAFHPQLAGIAASATGGYLRIVWNLYGRAEVCASLDEACETEVRAALADYFAGTVSAYDGFMSCSALPNQPHVHWGYVGYPYAARDIAACEDGRLYALNQDGSFYVNESGGIDTGWSYLDRAADATAITCAGSTVYAFNADKSLWRYGGRGVTPSWSYSETLASASAVAGNRERLFAFHGDGTLWTKPNGGAWMQVGAWDSAAVLAGAVERDPSSGLVRSRLFLLTSGVLHVNTSNGQTGEFTQIDTAADARRIAAGEAGVLYALNADATLYRGTILE